MRLALEAVRVQFDARTALREVHCDFAQGEHVAVCGAPASGKTTLLKVLAGLLRPSAGRVLWDDDDAFALPPDARRQRQAAFGMIFQTDALFDSSTLLQNVMLPLVKRGVRKEEARARADAVLEEVGLLDAGGLRPDQLSGGMRKRAGIARAIVARPDVLLADDPLAGLDPSTASQVAQLLERAARGRTLIVAMPDPTPWLSASRWLLLDDGGVTYDGPFDEARLERT